MSQSPKTTWLPNVTTQRLLRFLFITKYGSQVGYVATLAFLNAMLFLSPSPRYWFTYFVVSGCLTLLLVAGRVLGLFFEKLTHRRAYKVFEREVRRKVNHAQTRYNILYAGPHHTGKTKSIQFVQSRLGSEQYIHGATNYSGEGVMSHLYFVDVPPQRTQLSPLLGHLAEYREERAIPKGQNVGYSLSTIQSSYLMSWEQSSDLPIHGIIFVADSRLDYHEGNIEEWTWLKYFLEEKGYTPNLLPTVVQMSHTTAQNAIPASSMLLALEMPHNRPTVVADPNSGIGVLEALHLLIQQLET